MKKNQSPVFSLEGIGHMRKAIKRRFVIHPRDVRQYTHVFLAVPGFQERPRLGVEIWCKLNPWAKEHGGPRVMTSRPMQAYMDAAECEADGHTVRVVRLTPLDIRDLLEYEERSNA